jgi:hypothetical protein
MSLKVMAAVLALVIVRPAERANAQGVKSQFIGTWRLVAIQGDTAPSAGNRGGHPTGYIYYDATGHMAVQIQPDRKRASWSPTRSPTADEALDAVRGYTAYFGTWSVDEKAGTVTHHREGALNLGVLEYVRRYTFNGDRLTLAPIDRPGLSLLWERVR